MIPRSRRFSSRIILTSSETNMTVDNPKILINQMSNERKGPGCIGCIGDEILPFVLGFFIFHYRDPCRTARIQWKVRDPRFFSWGLMIHINQARAGDCSISHDGSMGRLYVYLQENHQKQPNA